MGVIVPNPTVETEDGTVSVPNVKKIEVTNGDLTNDGNRIVSIDTSGSGAAPAGTDGDYQLKNGDSFSTGVINGATNGVHTLTLDPTAASASASVRAFNAVASKQFILHSTTTAGAVKNAVVIMEDGASTGVHIATGSLPITTDSGKIRAGSDGGEMRVEGYGGTPALSLTNATNADVRLEPSGTGTVNVVSGGITFPDSTTQTTAASGGDVALSDWFTTVAEYTEDGSRLNKCYPLGWDQYGCNSTDSNNYLAAYGGMSDSFSYGRDSIISFPFVAGQTGTISSVTFRNGNSWPGQTFDMALYSDDGGLPDTKLFSWQFDLTSAGEQTVTSFTGTASIVVGTKYHLAYTASMTTGATHYFSGLQQMYNDVTGLVPQAAYPQEDWGGSQSLAYSQRGWALNWDATSLPASFTATDSQVWPDWGPPLVAVNYELA